MKDKKETILTPQGRGVSRNYTKRHIEKSLEKCNGIVHKTAKLLGMHKSSIYRMIDKYELRGYIEELRDRLVDEALAIVSDEMQGDPKLAMEYLKYSKRSENVLLNLNTMTDKLTINVDNKEQKDNLQKFLDK